MCVRMKPTLLLCQPGQLFPGVLDKFLNFLKGSVLVPQNQRTEEVPDLLAHLPHPSAGLHWRMDLLENSQVSLVVFWKQEASSETPEKELHCFPPAPPCMGQVGGQTKEIRSVDSWFSSQNLLAITRHLARSFKRASAQPEWGGLSFFSMVCSPPHQGHEEDNVPGLCKDDVDVTLSL